MSTGPEGNNPQHSSQDPGITQTVTIEDIGGSGDGIFRGKNAETCYVKYTVPGEKVEVMPDRRRKNHFNLQEVLTPSQERANPICNYFEKCGGCSVQHFPKELYNKWKIQSVSTALKNQGIPPPELSLIEIPAGVRRRASLSFENFKGDFKLGFLRSRSSAVVDISTCPILKPDLNSMLDPLRTCLSRICQPGDMGHILLSTLYNGIDIDIHFHRKRPKLLPEEMESICDELSQIESVIRVTAFGGKGISFKRAYPLVKLGKYTVEYPASGFLQPSHEGESAIVNFIANEVRKFQKSQNSRPLKIADLFSGLGTIGLSMLEFGGVEAYDSAGPSLSHLEVFVGKKSLNLLTFKRDLFSAPLEKHELHPFDVIILDPPRAGAADQVSKIDAKPNHLVLYVSCNPISFARDAKVLIQKGFEISKLTIVDQFLYTEHTEVVALFASVQSKE